MKSTDKYYVPKSEFKDFQTFSVDGDVYDGFKVPQEKAYDYAVNGGEIDFDELLEWYYEKHPDNMPVIAEVLEDKEAVIEFFYQDWYLYRGLQLVRGHK